MENPATWGDAEKIVNQTMVDYYETVKSGEALTGLSLIRQITDALRKAGLLAEEDNY